MPSFSHWKHRAFIPLLIFLKTIFVPDFIAHAMCQRPFSFCFELYNPLSNCISSQARAIQTFTHAVIDKVHAWFNCLVFSVTIIFSRYSTKLFDHQKNICYKISGLLLPHEARVFSLLNSCYIKNHNIIPLNMRRNIFRFQHYFSSSFILYEKKQNREWFIREKITLPFFFERNEVN